MNKLERKFLESHIGYLDERDEYQQGVLYKTLSTAHIYSYYLISLCVVMSVIVDSIKNTVTFGTIALFLIMLFNSCYIIIKLRGTDVDKTEFDDDVTYSILIKKLRKKTIVQGIRFGISMFILIEYIFPIAWGERVNIGLFQISLGIFNGILFGVGMYIVGKLKLKKVEND